jgi:hypothetical protein
MLGTVDPQDFAFIGGPGSKWGEVHSERVEGTPDSNQAIRTFRMSGRYDVVEKAVVLDDREAALRIDRVGDGHAEEWYLRDTQMAAR